MKRWLALLLCVPLLAQAAGDPVAGRKLFASCANCHTVGPSARHGFGPQLNGLVGRQAGRPAACPAMPTHPA